MTSLIYFILGICTVLLIGGVVYMFKIGKEVKKLKEFRSLTLQDFGFVKKDIDQKFNDVWKNFEIVNKDKIELIDKVYRDIDSRLDKLANKFQLKETEK